MTFKTCTHNISTNVYGEISNMINSNFNISDKYTLYWNKLKAYYTS